MESHRDRSTSLKMKAEGWQPAAGASRDELSLDELVASCLDRFESEGEAAVEDLCRSHPELAGSLRARICALRETGLLSIVSAGDRSFPEKLGEFELLESLGGGGMGVVYLAEQTSLGRKVALKLIRPERLYFPGSRERFRREVEAVARLAHPSIVPVYMVGEERGLPFFAMEHVRGASLAEVIAAVRDGNPQDLRGAQLLEAIRTAMREPLAGSEESSVLLGTWVEVCLRLVCQVAEALEHAHRRGVLHRDVKPSNVMVTPQGRALLMDFGLASQEGASQITQTGSRIGSLVYMAPEAVRGEATGASVDVYGLGVTLYELLALRLPFDGASEGEIQRKILEGRPVPLRKLNPSVPPDVETVCAAAIALEPERRYPSAEALARDLTNILERRPIEARRPGPLLRMWRWTQRRPAAALAGLLAVLLAVGGPLVFGIQQARARSRIAQANLGLNEALSVAQQERERAEANFESAMEAVDVMLTHVGDESLEDVPHMVDLRRELLEEALRFYERFLGQRGDDPLVRRRVASAQRRVGQIRLLLNQHDAAAQAFGEAAELWRELWRGADGVPGDGRELAGTLSDLVSLDLARTHLDAAEENARVVLEILAGVVQAGGESRTDRSFRAWIWYALGEVLRQTDRAAGAEEMLLRSTELFERLVSEVPQDTDSRYRLGVVLTGLARVLRDAERYQEAEECFRGAITAHEALLEREPRDSRLREDLARSYTSLALLYSRAESQEQAREVRSKALRILEQLVAEFPLVVRYRDDLFANCTNRGIDLAKQGALDEATTWLDRALEIQREIVVLHPDVTENRSKLATALANSGHLRLSQGAPDEAVALLREAIELQRQALEVNPRSPTFRAHMGNHYLVLVQAQLACGAHQQAAEAARGLVEHYPHEWLGLQEAGLYLGHCAALAAGDVSLGVQERAQLADAYASEALELLHLALRRGALAPLLLGRTQLQWLEPYPGFAGLRQELEARADG